MKRDGVSRGLGLAAALACAGLLAACVPNAPPATPAAPLPASDAIRLETVVVPLNPNNPLQQKIGDFVYAGGIAVTSPDTSRLHGLSDLKLDNNGRLLAISDDGDFFEAKLVLGEDGRLVGLTDGRLRPLLDPQGKPVQGKEWGDAEGLALMPNNDRLVSFERRHRIWLYPADGGPPREAPMPKTLFSDNEGMEALAAYPFAGPDAYLVGGEEGEFWLCRLSAGCEVKPTQALGDNAFGFVAVAPFNGPAMATLHRAWDLVRGNRLVIRIVADPLTRPRTQAAFTLEAPLTRDNFEGLALATRPDGGLRLYLLADDNFNPAERTLLMAFDWKPGK